MNESPARWLLAELSIRFSRVEIHECQRIVQTLQARHLREPGVSEGLYEILVSYGIMTPDGQLAGGPEPGEPAAVAATEPASKLWTPDAPAASGEQKSKLWIPGMD